MRRLNRHPRPDDRGAVVVIVALCMVVLLGAGAIAIDLGDAWAHRRGLVTGTDAAALAAAQAYASAETGCTAVAADFLTRNVPDAILTNCSHEAHGGRAGVVRVSSADTVQHYLAPVIGHDDTTVEATTLVGYGQPDAASGLRPFGLCVDAIEPEVWSYLQSGGGAPPVVTIPYDNSDGGCGSAPGNWGTIDFDGGSNSQNDTRDWTADGYPGLVNSATGTCDGVPNDFDDGCYPGDTGVAPSNAYQNQLDELVTSGEIFALPVFDLLEGNGSPARFRIIAFVSVRLVSWEHRVSMTIEFQRGVIQGTCCDHTGVDTGVRVLEICSVDQAGDGNCSAFRP